MLLIQRCGSDAPSVQALVEKLAAFGKKHGLHLQALDPSAAYSPLCIRAALEMQKSASASAKTPFNEKNTLLGTLALTQNFTRAIKTAGAKDARDFVLVAWENAAWDTENARGRTKGKEKISRGKLSSALSLKKLAWGKKDNAHFSRLYALSTEARRLCPLEKLIIEKMALARI